MDVKIVVLIVVAAVLLALLVFILIAVSRHWKKVNRSDTSKGVDKPGISATIIKAMGGLSNIIEVDAKMSRLYLTLVDVVKADTTVLKELGLTEAIVMEKRIVVVIGMQAKKIADEIAVLLSAKS